MTHTLLKASYGLLPPQLRSLAASFYGLQLRRWRYGSETEQLVEEALARESWSQQQWHVWTKDRLAAILERASSRVPFYRSYWNEHGGDKLTLQNWPFLEKEDLRTNPNQFLAEDCNSGKMEKVQTSGTTGTPLTIFRSRETTRQWYALFEARCRRWYGVSRFDRYAIIGGQLVTPSSRTKPPFWVWNSALLQLYMSAYHLSRDLIPHYISAMKHHRIAYLLGYTSALYAIAIEMLRRNQTIPLHVVITNAEPLYEWQREAMQAAFQCPVRETYGMAEAVAGASECEAGSLHCWPEAGVTELMNNDEFVCTGLLNADMPLIRYRIGDRGNLASSDLCKCGRTLPRIEYIEGRVDDVLITRDGRRIGRLDPIFKNVKQVIEAQIVQETAERIRLRYVSAPGFDAINERLMVSELKARMGDIEVVVEPVAAIARGANGKFRAVINLMGQNADQRI